MHAKGPCPLTGPQGWAEGVLEHRVPISFFQREFSKAPLEKKPPT